MAPPGGSTQINVFGGGEQGAQPEQNINACQAARSKSSVFAAPEESKPAAPSQQATSPQPGPGEQRSNSRTSTKVMAPPGGASSISFG